MSIMAHGPIVEMKDYKNLLWIMNLAVTLFLNILARLYEGTGRAVALPPASALVSASASTKMLKFYIIFLRPHNF